MRIGTRRSALALAQAQLVAQLLGSGEIVPIVTSGDRGVPTSDKSRWVAELEGALLSGEIDVAVHSAKDVPGELAHGLALPGAPPRAPVEDVLCGADGLGELPAGATVGTSSVRRAAQLRAAREDLQVVAMRGNVDTRLARLSQKTSSLDAVVLARAGVSRLGREDAIGAVLDPKRFVPAPGQGTLALEARADDVRVHEAIEAISDAETLACLLSERTLARELSATCHTPLGACAAPAGPGRLLLRAWVGLPDGSAWVADELLGSQHDPQALGTEVAARLSLAGAAEMLAEAQEMASVGGL